MSQVRSLSPPVFAPSGSYDSASQSNHLQTSITQTAKEDCHALAEPKAALYVSLMSLLSANLGAKQPTSQDIQNQVQLLISAVLERCSPLRIYLFGSALSGAFTHASDIDLVLIFADHKSLTLGRAQLYGHGPLSNRPYDLLLYTQEEFNEKAKNGGVCFHVGHTGKIVYDHTTSDI